ncbi:hypothetical protein, partial [Microvirga tunisiensis]|uniref:hypothetical protein n=1 Tax=Microvirga tunisiensis TaxID=2108360 RepID=UPI001AEF0106
EDNPVDGGSHLAQSDANADPANRRAEICWLMAAAASPHRTLSSRKFVTLMSSVAARTGAAVVTNDSAVAKSVPRSQPDGRFIDGSGCGDRAMGKVPGEVSCPSF